MKAAEIEIAVADWLGVGSNGHGKSSQHIIVPNFTGLTIWHECDIFVVTGSGYVWEIEIKVTKADLKADIGKKKWEVGAYSKYADYSQYKNIFRCLYFAMPESMMDIECAGLVPERAGILVIPPDLKCYQFRNPTQNMGARKLTPEEIITVGRLASRRIWGLKRKLMEK